MDQTATLNTHDYLEATIDASKRTRAIIVIIVVASIVTFAGFLNSLQHNWMLQRLRAAAQLDRKYIENKFPSLNLKEIEAFETDSQFPIKNLDSLVESDRKDILTKYPNLSTQYKNLNMYRQMYFEAMVKTYVDNTYTIRVPLFGITYDVNDLGLLGGLGFFVLLILLRLSFVRELDNLILSFEEAKSDKQLPTLYNLLAMQQVLTSPPMQGKEPLKILLAIPKILSLLPFIVLSVVLAHDFATHEEGTIVSESHTLILYVTTSILWTLVFILTISCLAIWLRIDATWQKYWEEIKIAKTMKISSRLEQPNAS